MILRFVGTIALLVGIVLTVAIGFFALLALDGRLADTSVRENVAIGLVLLVFALVSAGATVFLGAMLARDGRTSQKRGRCPKCNYDLRGELDKGCSECGWNRPEDDA